MEITFSADPAELSERAGGFLRGRLVENNLILTRLCDRVADSSTDGRYGWAIDRGDLVGAYFHSPPSEPALFAVTGNEIACRLAETAVEWDPSVPAVQGSPDAVAVFAGRWSELTGVGVVPSEARRLYQLAELRFPSKAPPGWLRRATDDDLELMARWRHGWNEELGDTDHGGVTSWAERAIESGRSWLWEHRTPTAMLRATQPVDGIARVGAVYTPPEHRRRGFASAATAAVTDILRGEGSTPILYSQASNPTANGIYRRLGYRSVQELLIYKFLGPE